MITPEFRARYEFFRKHGSYIVGESAQCAFQLAKAEERAEGVLSVSWSWCELPWDGEEPLPEDCELLDALCFHAEDVDEYSNEYARGAVCLASLGMVALKKGGYYNEKDPYKRVVEAELYAEAFACIDAESEKTWAREAGEMQARATYAGPA